MTDRPILFSGPMIRAILDGRKVQTRRVLSSRWTIDGEPSRAMWPSLDWGTAEARKTSTLMDAMVGPDKAPPDPHLRVQHIDRETWHRVRPPVYAGDTLWVRETISRSPMTNFLSGQPIETHVVAVYAADDEDVVEQAGFNVSPWWKGKGNLPAIHMPRWASRINLVVTDVRVQRLQEISEEDAIAEGVRGVHQLGDELCKAGTVIHASASVAFMVLWESINGPGSWDANPWVYALTFERKR